MNIVRTIVAYGLAVAAAYAASVLFYTQQVIAKMAAVGAIYTTGQKIDTFVQNFTGLWQMAAIIAVAFLIALPVAFVLKRVLKPLAPIAYPAAGAAAMVAMIMAIESILGGGAGVMAGARGPVGLTLQALAGFLGGAAFAFARPR
jgi:hypothetical protein